MRGRGRERGEAELVEGYLEIRRRRGGHGSDILTSLLCRRLHYLR